MDKVDGMFRWAALGYKSYEDYMMMHGFLEAQIRSRLEPVPFTPKFVAAVWSDDLDYGIPGFPTCGWKSLTAPEYEVWQVEQRKKIEEWKKEHPDWVDDDEDEVECEHCHGTGYVKQERLRDG